MLFQNKTQNQTNLKCIMFFSQWTKMPSAHIRKNTGKKHETVHASYKPVGFLWNICDLSLWNLIQNSNKRWNYCMELKGKM